MNKAILSRLYMYVQAFTELEKLAINDALPLNTAWGHVIAKLKSFSGFESELQTNLMLFYLDSQRGAT